MATRRCETCEFYENEDDEELEAQGFCHRYPPPANTAINEAYLPPIVFSDGWCGEWRAKEAEVAQEVGCGIDVDTSKTT